MDPRTDAELVVAARGGDRVATEQLLARHAPALLRFTTRRCSDPVDAEDVVQEALVSALRALPDLRADAAVAPWLFTIARRACGRMRRRRSHAPAAVLPLEDVDAEAPEPAPDHLAAEREIGASLEAGLLGLKERDREVLLLRDVEGLSAPEVAEILGIEVDAVKSRLHRARAALRERMEPTLGAARTRRRAACPDIVGPFSRYLEGEIGAAECASMKEHVEGCPSCNAACTSLRRTIDTCRIAGAEVPPALQAQVRRALTAALGRV
jgi:RNA polymerase sigma-70 factor (ECF subfamily)